jgi:hypothetical protein
MGTAVGDLVVNLLGNGAPLQQALARSKQDLGGWSSQAAAAASQVASTIGKMNFGPLLGQLSALGTAGGLAAFVGETHEKAREISRGAKEMGISAEFYQRLGSAAQKAGHDIETVRGSFARMQESIASAVASGNKGVFAMLNLSPEKMLGQDAEAQYRAVAKAIMEIQNATERTHAEMELFGRSGHELEAVLAKVADGTLDKMKALSDQTVFLLNQQKSGTWQTVTNAGAAFLAKTELAGRVLGTMIGGGVSRAEAMRQVQQQITAEMGKQKENASASAAAAATALRAEKERADAAKALAAIQGRLEATDRAGGQYSEQSRAMLDPGPIADARRRFRQSMRELDEMLDAIPHTGAAKTAEDVQAINYVAQLRSDAAKDLRERIHSIEGSKEDELEFRITLVGLSAAQKESAELAREGFSPDATAQIFQYRIQLEELGQIHDLGLRVHAAEVGELRVKLDELAAGGWSQEFIEKYKDMTLKLQAHETEMHFSPMKRLQKQLQDLRDVRDYIDKATYKEARKKTLQAYLDETHQGSPASHWSESQAKGSREAFETIMAAINDAQQAKDQQEALDKAERTAKATEASAQALATIANRGGDESDVEDLAGASRS